ncbi:hypothetical protein M0R04_08070 [Candidatus Dojkabacteria bacterium]|jgi:hypothetical protein|nr:hypothetical protein [Candidatus Dojkabacteria bacterium]
MKYIKHSGKFYQEIDLKDLDKKELIKLIMEAVEVEPTIVERRKEYPVYVDRYKWRPSVTYCN